MFNKQEDTAIHVDTRQKPESVPYVVYEDATADKQWVIKKLVRALVVALIIIFASNMAWLWVWQSYDYSSTEMTVDSSGSGIANYTGGNGGVRYGESYSQEDNEDTQ